MASTRVQLRFALLTFLPLFRVGCLRGFRQSWNAFHAGSTSELLAELGKPATRSVLMFDITAGL
jgi:hypothetical protein